MKLKDLITSALDVFNQLQSYSRLKLDEARDVGAISALGLLIWAIIFITMTTKLVHLAGFESPLKEMQRSIDKQDEMYQLIVKDEQLAVDKVVKYYPVGTRPIIQRIDILSTKFFCQEDNEWWEGVFFTPGIEKQWGVCLSVKYESSTEQFREISTIISNSKGDIESAIKTMEIDDQLLASIQKDQKEVRDSIISEARLGFGFVRLVFKHIQVGELGNNEAFLFIFLVTTALSIALTFHISAFLFQRYQSLTDVVDLGIRNLSIWIILLGIINVVGCFLDLDDVENTYLLYMVISATFIIFLLPSIIAWKNAYKLSWPRFTGITLLCFPVSILPGIIIFAPIGYVAIVYNDVFAIFI